MTGVAAAGVEPSDVANRELIKPPGTTSTDEVSGVAFKSKNEDNDDAISAVEDATCAPPRCGYMPNDKVGGAVSEAELAVRYG